jgi:uncharacterized protein (DUF488 family)
MAAEVCTIGYEGAALEDFVATLRLADIAVVVDIRELPLSRRKGFSKTALGTTLEEEGIAYAHLKGLGDPKEGRDAAKRGDFERFITIFNAHMATEIALADLRRAARLVAAERACLLCFEREYTNCHRAIVAAHISEITGQAIRHLGVSKGAALRLAGGNGSAAAYA